MNGDAADDDLQTQYRRLLQRIEANEGEFRRLGRSVWRVQEDERRRLARELHDGVGQNLTALKHQLALVAASLPPAQAGQRDKLEAAIALCAATLEDTRELSRLLRPPILDDLGLEPALRSLARSLHAGGGPEIELDFDPEALPALNDDLRTLLFRVVQEALNNIVKHAQASQARVQLRRRGNELRLLVEDDGRGCDPMLALRSGGCGLGGMRERLRLYGGRFEIQSSVGTGTRLFAAVALDAA